MKKRILALGPVMPHEFDIEGIAKDLSFLNENFQLDFIDPLMNMDALPTGLYYLSWQRELADQLSNYDAFLGFSFGGVILQQCFSVFEGTNKPILLFSTPTFANEPLREKLGRVIALCKKNWVMEALKTLYKEVFYPNKPPQINYNRYDQELAARRLIFGLQRVLDTDSTQIVSHSAVEHLHLIGEFSNLVNVDNVITPKVGQLIIVPQAGMRVLHDNHAFCQKLIVEYLKDGA
ncbi:hypothetical protein Lnau_3004 [Legionella nautarum]|uniref:Alpha/beta hydrolase n=1 Tax=Legionella nautarum TaxID=45070 RepID=A0A0W0WM07_9GAMM|nr:hypothetical protein [Legionella nautarum]KTD33356.1 hypothetical protein Lnau_3004 [Legionella nautarum]